MSFSAYPVPTLAMVALIKRTASTVNTAAAAALALVIVMVSPGREPAPAALTPADTACKLGTVASAALPPFPENTMVGIE